MSVYFSYFTKGDDSDSSQTSPFSALQNLSFSFATTALERIKDVATNAATSLRQALTNEETLPDEVAKKSPLSFSPFEEEKDNEDYSLSIDLRELGNGQLEDLIDSFNRKSESGKRAEIRTIVTTKLIPDLERNLKLHFNPNHDNTVPKDMKKAGRIAIGLNDHLMLNRLSLLERYLTLNFCNQQVFAIAMEASKSDVYDLFASKIKNHPHLSDELKNQILSDFNESKYFKIVPGTMEPIQITIKDGERTVSSAGKFAMGIVTDHGPISLMEFNLSFQIDMKTLKMKLDRNFTKFDLSPICK